MSRGYFVRGGLCPGGILSYTQSGESVEEFCWFRKTRCNRKVIVFMITWGM